MYVMQMHDNLFMFNLYMFNLYLYMFNLYMFDLYMFFWQSCNHEEHFKYMILP